MAGFRRARRPAAALALGGGVGAPRPPVGEGRAPRPLVGEEVVFSGGNRRFHRRLPRVGRGRRSLAGAGQVGGGWDQAGGSREEK